MEELIFIDRKNTNCMKWDNLSAMFGREDLHAMWVADMDIKAPECVRKALVEYAEFGGIGYYKAPDSYYESIIAWEKSHHGFEAKKEWIRFSPGVVAAFNWLIQMMTKEGDAVIVTTPVYYPFLNAVKDNGRTLITSDLINNDGVYTVDYEDFERQIVENDVKLFILCSPHNPVGRVWKREELEQVLAICKRYHVFVISDEIHQDLLLHGVKHTPSFCVTDDWSNMVTLMAASKTFNLAGAQHAVVLIPDEKLQMKWDTFVSKIHLANGNAFGYIATEAAYKGGEEWYQQMLALIQDNDAYLRETLAKELPKVIVTPLEGTYLAWVDLRAYVKPEDTTELILNQCKLAVDFGDWFGGDRFAGWIRINLATSRENVEIGVQALVDVLKIEQ